MKRLLLILFALGPSCNGSSSDPDPVVTPKLPDPQTAGTIRGKVSFAGAPPANPRLPVGGNPECAFLHTKEALNPIILVKDGRLQNTFVRVKSGVESYVFDWPRTPVTMANQACLYTPRVIAVQVHQPVRFTNEDPAAHNIHGFARQGSFNFTLHGKGTSNEVKFRSPETMIPVKCDLHPWMLGHVGVVPHPYFQVTGPDGVFELKGLPPGELELEAWHEALGTQTRKVKLDPKASLDVDFSFSGSGK